MRERLWSTVLLGILVVPVYGRQALALPDLTEAQRIQLATADDTRPPDEPALYGLLANVAAWEIEQTAADLAAAGLPGYGAIPTEPAAARGEVYLVEGRYAGRQRRMGLRRSGPWGDALTEWGVVADSGEVLVLYLVDPDGQVAPPREGARVRVAARFYKLWSDVDAAGTPTVYPVLIGRSAQVVAKASADRTVGGLVIGGIVALSAMLFWIKRLGRRGATRRKKNSARLRDEAKRDPPSDEDPPPLLPADAAQALAELAQQKK